MKKLSDRNVDNANLNINHFKDKYKESKGDVKNLSKNVNELNEHIEDLKKQNQINLTQWQDERHKLKQLLKVANLTIERDEIAQPMIIEQLKQELGDANNANTIHKQLLDDLEKQVYEKFNEKIIVETFSKKYLSKYIKMKEDLVKLTFDNETLKEKLVEFGQRKKISPELSDFVKENKELYSKWMLTTTANDLQIRDELLQGLLRELEQQDNVIHNIFSHITGRGKENKKDTEIIFEIALLLSKCVQPQIDERIQAIMDALDDKQASQDNQQP